MFDYTFEECLGKTISLKFYEEEDKIDHVTEIWPIAKPGDYDLLVSTVQKLTETDMLVEYYLYD